MRNYRLVNIRQELLTESALLVWADDESAQHERLHHPAQKMAASRSSSP